ncbi:MAG TPA: CotH kinase family protein [Kofleriaceae bacterium]|nr:CotH kinase family protein [Kofleriaceae bacterium]
MQRLGMVVALVAYVGCGDDDALDAGDAGAPAELTVARVLPWPGGGVQVTIEWPDPVPPGWDGPAASIETADGETPAVVIAPHLDAGITAVLLVPDADDDVHAARLAAAAAFIDALPDDEAIALLVAGDEAPVLLVELPGERARLHAELEAIAPAAGRAAPHMPLLREAVADLESRYTAPARAIAVVGEDVPETEPGLFRPVQTVSMVPEDPAGGGAALAAALATRRARLLRVGACPALAGTAAPFTLVAGDTATPLLAPEPMEHLAGAACDPAAAAADAFPYPEEIAIELTADERAIYDQRLAGPSDEPFRGSVRLGDDAAPLPADLRLRGQASLYCGRKSYSVVLDGERRRLGPEHASDRFLLISMCLDLRYFGQLFGDRLLADRGLFPSRIRHVRLRVDGVDLGVYLLLEPPERAFRDGSLGLTSVVRRGYDILGQPSEVKFPDEPDPAAAAQARFDALGQLALDEPPGTLEAALDARLDLDAYLEMLALYSLLENGDYIDEAFFASSDEAGVERYRHMGWDTDDLFSACHGDGASAIADSCGVLYCAEAKLDQALVRSPAIYQRYLDALARVLDEESPARLAGVMNEVRNELWRAIDSDETAAALAEMVAENPGAATVAGARADIASWMDWALAHVEARRAALRELLTACTPGSRATR